MIKYWVMIRRDFRYMANDFGRHISEITRFLDTDFPEIIAVEAESHFKRSFENQGFTDAGLSKWQARKIPKSARQAKQSEGRAILVGLANKPGTHLRDSIEGIPGRRRAVIRSNKIYAGVHNEGLRAGRGKGFMMPKRQFIGPSEVMDRRIGSKVKLTLDGIFNR